MGERLRKVAGMRASARLDLLGVQAERGRAPQHALEECHSLIPTPGERQVLDQPKGAWGEGDLTARNTE